MQRAAINQLSNGIALPNRSCIVQCRRKSRNIVALVPRERLEPDRSNFRSLSQAALTLDQSQLMERTMLCPRITQQSLRKPLDAGCFEGDSTKAGPKPPVQLYERDDLRSHLQNFSTRNAVISTAYGEWCNGSLSGSGPNPVLQCHPILIRLFPATSETFAKLFSLSSVLSRRSPRPALPLPSTGVSQCSFRRGFRTNL